MKAKSLLILLVAVFAAVSCNKYPDGPGLSLRSKKARLANSWVVTYYEENGQDKTNDFRNAFVNYNMVIHKEGNYSVFYRPFNLADHNEAGTWDFTDDKTSVTFMNSANNETSTWKILKLMESELWAQFTDSSTVSIVHLAPKP